MLLPLRGLQQTGIQTKVLAWIDLSRVEAKRTELNRCSPAKDNPTVGKAPSAY